MRAKVENHVRDIAKRITATATVHVGDISGANKLRENRAEEYERFRIG